MIIGSISENKILEKRISITPDLVKKYVSQGFKVLMSGEGADEVFGGYAAFLPMYWSTVVSHNHVHEIREKIFFT